MSQVTKVPADKIDLATKYLKQVEVLHSQIIQCKEEIDTITQQLYDLMGSAGSYQTESIRFTIKERL